VCYLSHSKENILLLMRDARGKIQRSQKFFSGPAFARVSIKSLSVAVHREWKERDPYSGVKRQVIFDDPQGATESLSVEEFQ